jgi:hypothetical protein
MRKLILATLTAASLLPIGGTQAMTPGIASGVRAAIAQTSPIESVVCWRPCVGCRLVCRRGYYRGYYGGYYGYPGYYGSYGGYYGYPGSYGSYGYPGYYGGYYGPSVGVWGPGIGVGPRWGW